MSEFNIPREDIETRRKKIAYEIYSENIGPDHDTLVVGPSNHALNDPSLLYVSHLLSEGQGKLYIADPLHHSLGLPGEEIKKQIPGLVTGIGNVASYLSDIEELQKIGLHLKTPRWLGGRSAAQQTLLANGSVDRIVDHGTSIFLSGLPGTLQNKSVLEPIFKEYSRILKVCQTNGDMTH